MKINATAVYIIDPSTQSVLLAKKTRKIGIGKWFGYGGKEEEVDNHDPIACSLREVEKETNGVIKLDRSLLVPIALIDFYNSEDKVPGITDPIRVLYYRTEQIIPVTPLTSDEMENPTWFLFDAIPWKTEMKAGDELFIKPLLNDEPVKGWVWFTKDEKTVLGSDIKPCSLEDLTW